MKDKKLFIAAVVVCVAMAFVAFTGCSDSEDEYIDESEFTVDYLYGEYSDQLMRDGADTILGSVEITGEEGNYKVTVTEKEVVMSEDYDEGYYVAETNAVEEYGLGGYAQIVYADKNGEAVIGDARGYIDSHNGEPDNLYTVYHMNGNVELMLPVDPKDVEVQY